MAVMIDDQFDARPQSGLLGATSCGRRRPRAASRATWPCSRPATRRPSGPVRSSRLLLHRLGLRVALRVRARRRLAAGEGAARARRRAAARSSTTPTSSAGAAPLPVAGPHPLRAAQRVHGRQAPAAAGQAGRRRAGRRSEAGLELRPTRSARAAAGGRRDRRPVPRQQDHLQVRPQTQHLPPLGDRREEADRRGHPRSRIAPTNVVVMAVRFAPLNDGTTRAASRPRSRARARRGSRPTARRSRATWKKPMTGPDPLLRQERQAGHADPRADVHPGRPAELQADDHAGQGRRARRPPAATATTGAPVGSAGARSRRAAGRAG